MIKQKSLLIVSATEKEIEALLMHLQNNHLPVNVCITGPGIAATVFHLTRALVTADYSLVVNAGIAGSFSSGINTGEVVEVTHDCFADLGAEDADEFIHISEMGFRLNSDAFKNYFFPVSVLPVMETHLPKVKAITVNKVHGHEPSILKIKQKFHAEIESMEGAAVAYVCNELNIPCKQIRSISNRVEKRDKSKWETEKAIQALNRELIHLLPEFLKSF